MTKRFQTLDIVDFPSDTNRIWGGLRKELLLAVRKCRRQADYNKSNEYIEKMEELLAFCQEVLDEYKYIEKSDVADPVDDTPPDKPAVVRDKPKPKTRAKRKPKG